MRNKGNYYEKKSIKFLEKQGYACEQAKPKIIWIFKNGKRTPITKSYDFFQCADIIALGPEDTLLVQVKHEGEKTNLWLAEVRRKFQKLPKADNRKYIIHVWKKGDKTPEIEYV